MDEFLADTADEPSRQVVVLGAGYDTRSLRYRTEGVQFIEVGLNPKPNPKIVKI